MKYHAIMVAVFVAGALGMAAARAQITAGPPAAPAVTLPASNLSLPTLPPVTANATTLPATVRVTPVIPREPAAAFAAGLAAYNQGNFAEAVGDFAAAAAGGATSAALEFDWGNADYETADYGGAILHYRRSLALNPRDPDARANLALAQRAANVATPEPTSFERLAGLVTLNQWMVLLAVCIWVTLYLMLIPRLYRWRGVLPWGLCLLAALAAGMCGAAVVVRHGHAHDGVILRADTQLRFSPTPGSAAIGLLQPGEPATELRVHGGYFNVQTADGRAGWVAGDSYAPIYGE